MRFGGIEIPPQTMEALRANERVGFSRPSRTEAGIHPLPNFIQQFLPFDMDKPMGQVRQLDKRMNDAGLLRLMVSDPLVMNMSNTLGYLRGGLKVGEKKKSVSLGKRVLEVGFIKKILLAVYNKIFSWYYS